MPQMPELSDADLTEEEKQAEEVLRALLRPDLEAGGDVGDEAAAEREFQAWVDALRAGSGAAGQAGEGDEGDLSELRALIDAAGLQDMDVSGVMSSAGSELQELSALLQQLAAPGVAGAGEDSDSDTEDLEGAPASSNPAQERQVLAALQRTDPALYALLASTTPLEDDAEMGELEAALDSFERMGLGDDGELLADIEAATADSAAAAAGGQAPGGQEVEEELSDAEVAKMAESDPDLAALLRGDDAKVEKLVRGLAGDDDDGADGDGAEDDEEADFTELFEAIDEDPDISEADKARARFELASMFNAPASSSRDDEDGDVIDVAAGPDTSAVRGTTTGQVKAASQGDVDLTLRPKPKPRRSS